MICNLRRVDLPSRLNNMTYMYIVWTMKCTPYMYISTWNDYYSGTSLIRNEDTFTNRKPQLLLS